MSYEEDLDDLVRYFGSEELQERIDRAAEAAAARDQSPYDEDLWLERALFPWLDDPSDEEQ